MIRKRNRKINYFVIFALIASFLVNPETAFALTEIQLNSNFRLSIAMPDGSFETQADYATFAEAETAMENSSDPNVVVQNLTRSVGNGVVDMKDGIVVIAAEKTKQPTLTLGYTSVNNGNDAYFYSSTGSAVNFGISGYDAIGVSVESLELIPRVQVKCQSYYSKNTNGDLVHSLETYKMNDININRYSNTPSAASAVPLGKAPSFMEMGIKYYSEDGCAFYKSPQLNTYAGTYYVYYKYLPFRSRTNYTAEELNSYIDFWLKIFPNSVLKEKGQVFIDAQTNYGVNALLLLSIAVLESNYGTSAYAIEKNNIFGINALDGTPDASYTYDTVEESIECAANRMISQGYTDAIQDPRYFGAHLGNKRSGINVKYASDPYWGEKIASFAVGLDGYLENKDSNKYLLAFSNSVVDAKIQPDTASATVYRLENRINKNYPVNIPVIIEQNINGWYKIQSDMPMDAAGNAYFSYQYDFDLSKVYVDSTKFTLLNVKPQEAPTGLAGIVPTTYGANDGKISGATDLMEYRSSNDTSYTAVTGATITGLRAGTYYVRYVARTGYNAGTDAPVVITDGPKNLSAGKLFTSSVILTNPAYMTDGNKATGSFAEDYPNGGGLQYVQLDLEAYYDLSKINLWHYYGDGRKYHDVIVQVSNDPTFATDITTVYNNDTDNSAGFGIGKDAEYTETSAGQSIQFDKINARYVRLYSNGSNKNNSNHYVEAEVYGIKGAVVQPASLSLNKATDALAVGGTSTLTAKIMPLNTTEKSVTWSSSDTGVAIVSPTGGVTGVSAGTATITVATKDGDLKASCDVTVTIAPSNLAAGKLFTSPVIFKNLACMTDNNRATSNFSEDYPNGGGLQYVQLDLGSYYDLSTINFWHYYGDGRKYKDVIVRVSNDPNFATDVTTVYNNDSNNSAGFGIGTDSEYTETSAGQSIQFDKINARYVRLYSNGNDKNNSNHYVEAEVYGVKGAVVHPATVSLNKSAETLAAGAADTLTADIMPLNTTDKSVTWSSSDTGVATISSTGVVTGVAAGTATITAATNDGDLKASCDVTVTTAPATSNLAKGKLFTSSASSNLSLITDGSKNTNGYTDDYPSSGLQYVQVDLGGNFDISDIKLWHYFSDGRKYYDVIVQVSNDLTFTTGVKTVFNNDRDNSAGRGTGSNSEYAETSSGMDISFDAVNGRYVRFYSNGSTVNKNNHYIEIEINGSKSTIVSNQASGKTMTSSVNFANLSRVTDGTKSTGSFSEDYPAGVGLQWLQVDLGIPYNISDIKLWHYFGDSRKYHDVVVQVSGDPTFKTGVTTVYNNDIDGSAGLGTGTGTEYTETRSGLEIPVTSANGRYVRFYSNGSTANNNNHYVEIEVYGK